MEFVIEVVEDNVFLSSSHNIMGYLMCLYSILIALLAVLKDAKIILRKAFWADSFLNHDTVEVLLFDAKRLVIVNKNNEFLKNYMTLLN
jgi:hypothetical protein